MSFFIGPSMWGGIVDPAGLPGPQSAAARKAAGIHRHAAGTTVLLDSWRESVGQGLARRLSHKSATSVTATELSNARREVRNPRKRLQGLCRLFRYPLKSPLPPTLAHWRRRFLGARFGRRRACGLDDGRRRPRGG